METKYTLSAYSKETEKTCDKAFKSLQSLLVQTAKIINPFLVPQMWIMTRFYKKTVKEIGDGKWEISYNLYLLTPNLTN